ncbi:DNA-binding protein [Halorhabdus rudnickae]|uniref:DNA-binding protein n=1 Tax=Halorhabdus rudnickae TaxID=1775544 RepID=UPI001082ABAE|nr:DNA-binding protein [Halorhabdus rudnickae]
MSGKQLSTNEVSVDAQALEPTRERSGNDGVGEVVEDTPEFRPSVQQETQAKVDSNHPDGMVQDFSHLTLEQEERIKAREAELEHISAQAELTSQDGRARRTREVVIEDRRELRRERQRSDPRERLSQDELASVNREADRIAKRFDGGPRRAAIARVLAERVVRGQDLTEAVFETIDEWKAEPGVICPIADVPDVQSNEVDIEGEVIELWAPSDPAIAQVGLIVDETSTIKFTSWKKSDPKIVQEGETVRMYGVKKNWYDGRCSVAVTYHSRIEFPERDCWWE